MPSSSYEFILSRVISSTHMVFTGFIACCFLKEPCGVFETFIVTLIIGGVGAVVQPESIFGSDLPKVEESGDGLYQQFIAKVVLLLGSVSAAVSFVVAR